MKQGRTLGLYGLSGSGKTTQIGEYAKFIKKTTGKKTQLHAMDMGGFDSIMPLIDIGLIDVDIYNEADDPWTWINAAVSTVDDESYGLKAFDSGTSVGEALIAYCAKAAAEGTQIGQERMFRLTIPTKAEPIVIGANNKSQYGLIQTFLLDMVWKSTWLARRSGVDVMWTFGEHRAEDPNDAPIVGPKLAGKALTGSIPKWLRYTLRMVSIPGGQGEPARHVLYCQEQPELNGLGMSFANARYPLDATTPLPAMIEPASLPLFWNLIQQAEDEAKAKLTQELF